MGLIGHIKNELVPKRLAFTPAEFARAFGHHVSWGYRLIYSGRVRVISDVGRLLIPSSEVQRLLESAAPYNPPNGRKKSRDLSPDTELVNSITNQ